MPLGIGTLGLTADYHVGVSKRNCCKKRNKQPKFQFGSEEEALRVAIRMIQQKNQELEAYRCPVCQWWHVGHPVKVKVRMTPEEHMNSEATRLHRKKKAQMRELIWIASNQPRNLP